MIAKPEARGLASSAGTGDLLDDECAGVACLSPVTAEYPFAFCAFVMSVAGPAVSSLCRACVDRTFR